MIFKFKYSDHTNKFKRAARDLEVDVWDRMDGAIFLSCPSPEAVAFLQKFIEVNQLVLEGNE